MLFWCYNWLDNWLFCVFCQFIVYFTLKVGELKALHIIMCKRDTENMKVAPESVLSNGESRRYALDQVFAGGGRHLQGGYLRTPPGWVGLSVLDKYRDGRPAIVRHQSQYRANRIRRSITALMWRTQLRLHQTSHRAPDAASQRLSVRVKEKGKQVTQFWKVV